jgi:hypothetical protein
VTDPRLVPWVIPSKTVITALALTAMLATSAVAKPQRTNATRIQPDNTVAEFHIDPD